MQLHRAGPEHGALYFSLIKTNYQIYKKYSSVLHLLAKLRYYKNFKGNSKTKRVGKNKINAAKI